MNVAPATAVQVPPELAERARREARADAEAKMKAAMESIMYAQQILWQWAAIMRWCNDLYFHWFCRLLLVCILAS